MTTWGKKKIFKIITRLSKKKIKTILQVEVKRSLKIITNWGKKKTMNIWGKKNLKKLR